MWVRSLSREGRKKNTKLFHLFPLLPKRLCVRQFFFPYSFERRTVSIDWLRIWLGGSTRCSGPIQVLKEITISRLVHAWPTNHSIFKQRTFSWVFNSFDHGQNFVHLYLICRNIPLFSLIHSYCDPRSTELSIPNSSEMEVKMLADKPR